MSTSKLLDILLDIFNPTLNFYSSIKHSPPDSPPQMLGYNQRKMGYVC
jgi:hypothetical protein